jgi:hypothetical protein
MYVGNIEFPYPALEFSLLLRRHGEVIGLAIIHCKTFLHLHYFGRQMLKGHLLI